MAARKKSRRKLNEAEIKKKLKGVSDLSIEQFLYFEKDKLIELEVDLNNSVINYLTLKKLSEIFCTEEINVSDFAFDDGCPTCGTGRSKTAEIYIYNPKM